MKIYRDETRSEKLIGHRSELGSIPLRRLFVSTMRCRGIDIPEEINKIMTTTLTDYINYKSVCFLLAFLETSPCSSFIEKQLPSRGDTNVGVMIVINAVEWVFCAVDAPNLTRLERLNFTDADATSRTDDLSVNRVILSREYSLRNLHKRFKGNGSLDKFIIRNKSKGLTGTRSKNTGRNI